MSATKKVKSSVQVMVNGLPGNMGVEVSNACLRRGFELASVALTGPNMPGKTEVGEDKVAVSLVAPDDADVESKLKTVVDDCEKAGKTLVAIDFTHPTAVNQNAKLYAKLKIPFVMGTTGGDRDELMKDTTESGVYAVIAPNMCKQIVALQAMLDNMSSQYPGAFSGYTLDVVESHQNGKADTSGTAKDLVKYFNKLRGDESFNVEDIQKIREPAKQIEFGVPEDAIKGHAWHTYTLKSSDESVMFQFKHNVCGRSTYAEGVADAVAFLAEKVAAGEDKKVYNMIDVLQSGAMN